MYHYGNQLRTYYRFQFYWGFRLLWKNKKLIGWTLFLIKSLSSLNSSHDMYNIISMDVLSHMFEYTLCNKWCQQLGGTYSSHTIGTTWINRLNKIKKLGLIMTQGQHRCQKIWKNLKNYVLVSDFATRQLNLRKPKKTQKLLQKTPFFLKKCNSKKDIKPQRNHGHKSD